MAKQPKGELVPVVVGFEYSQLSTEIAENLRTTAARIREKVKKTLEDIIEVGNDLLSVKDTLPHGAFGDWLRAEFGWTDRTARNFMAVAQHFGAKTEIISDLGITPTAAYMLAAPSAPDEARELALERAEAGEQVTPTVAKEILAKARKKVAEMPKTISTEDLATKLLRSLERFRDRWSAKEITELVRHLREFADQVEKAPRGGRKKERARRKE